MNKLQQQIRNLELNLETENKKIRQDSFLLKRNMNSKLLVLLEIGGGFLAGYLLLKSKRKVGLMGALFSLIIAAQRMKKNLFLLSYLIKK